MALFQTRSGSCKIHHSGWGDRLLSGGKGSLAPCQRVSWKCVHKSLQSSSRQCVRMTPKETVIESTLGWLWEETYIAAAEVEAESSLHSSTASCVLHPSGATSWPKEDTRLRPVRLRPVAEVEIGRSRTGRSLIDLHSQPKIIFIIIIIITFTCFFCFFVPPFSSDRPLPDRPPPELPSARTAQNFALFFPLSRHNFHSFFFFSGILSWFFGCV